MRVFGLFLFLVVRTGFPLTPDTLLRETFESQLFTLPPAVQAHYAVRLYRTTGDKKFLPSALYGAHHQGNALYAVAAHLEDKNFKQAFTDKLRDKQPLTYKGKLRRKTLTEGAFFAFYGERVLFPMIFLKGLGLKSRDHAKIMQHLKQLDFRALFLEPEIIRAWSAQVVNWIVWLNQLGIVDLRKEFQFRFWREFGDHKKLLGSSYSNFIYGLTHFILAESHYFQRYMDPEKYAWILDYFEVHIDKIIKETKADVIAEVGLSFLLSDEEHHPVVTQCRAFINAAIDPQIGMIPSTKNEADLATGEHRNVLAILLFQMPRPLLPGPLLAQEPSTQNSLPFSVLPE